MAEEFTRLLANDEIRRFDQALPGLTDAACAPAAMDMRQAKETGQRGLELTEHEERTWLRQQQDPDAVLKHVAAYRLVGGADIGRLIGALRATLAKIPGLDVRYRFDNDDGLRKYDGGGASQDLHVRRVESCADAVNALLTEQEKPWNLEVAAPVSFTLFLARDEVILGVVAHHILDGASPWKRIFGSLSQLYNEGLEPEADADGYDDRERAPPAEAGWIAAIESDIGQSLAPWLQKSKATNELDIIDFGKASFLEKSLRARAAARYGAQTDATPFLRLLESHPTPQALLAAGAALFGRYLSALNGGTPVDICMQRGAAAAMSDFGISFAERDLVRATLRHDSASEKEDIRQIIADLERQEDKRPAAAEHAAFSHPRIFVTWLTDPSAYLRLSGLSVERLPTPSMERNPDLILGIGWDGAQKMTLELVTGQGLSPTIGAFLLERFIAFVEEDETIAAVAFDGLLRGAAGAARRTSDAEPSATSSYNGANGVDEDAVAQLILAEFRQALLSPAMTVHDDFFDYGGHSLVATRVVGRLLTIHGVEVRFNDLFSHPTAAALSKYARRRGDGDTTSAVLDQKSRASQVAPLSLAQKSLWKAYEAFGYNEIFNLPFALRFMDRVDEQAFERAFLDVLERHPGLRTLFRKEGGDVQQQVVSLDELSHYKWFWRSEESRSVDRRSEGGHHFDLAHELPLRLRFMIEEATGRQILSFLFHHIVLDEWSVNLMMDELGHAYRRRVDGEAPRWENQPAPFHEFAIHQNDAGLNQAHLAYWTETLRGAPKGGPIFKETLIAEGDAKQEASSAGGWVELKLERAVSEGLYALAKENSASLFNVVYSAIAASLHFLGSLNDIVIGTSASGRNNPQFFDTIGYFTTVVAHRVKFPEGITLAGLIEQVKNSINDSLPHTDIPIDLVEEALGAGQGKDHLFEIFIQLHAKNKFNGAFTLSDGRTIEFQQVDPDRNESLLGLQFEVMEETVAGERTIRVLMSYRSDHYNPEQVALIRSTTSKVFSLFSRAGGSQRPLAAFWSQINKAPEFGS